MFLQVRHNHYMDMQLLALRIHLKRKRGQVCPVGKINCIQKSGSIATEISVSKLL